MLEFYIPVVTSTMDVAREIVSQTPIIKTRDWFSVRAGHQTRGRGRRSGPWYDTPGKAVLGTVVRSNSSGSARYDTTVPARVGLGVSRAIEALGATVSIKWPNDILLGTGKLAGILVDTDATATYVGVGCNLEPIDHEVTGLRPASLAEIGVTLRADVLWTTICDAVAAALSDERWNAEVNARLAWRDEEVEVSGFRARIDRINNNGSLRVITQNGEAHDIITGTPRKALPRS